MSRPCSVCQLKAEALKRLGELVKMGTSQRDIVACVNNEFDVQLTQGSLNRHLNNCDVEPGEAVTPPSENLDYVRQKMKLPTLLGFQSFGVLRRLLDEHLEAYNLKIERKRLEGIDVSESDLKELDLILKMHERLYPGESLENRKRADVDPRPVPLGYPSFHSII